MSRLNAWANPSQASVEEAAQMAAFLEERLRAPDAQQVNLRLCATLAARSGERLLEVGSGSGLLCRMLAPQLQPGGCIIGVDISPEMTVQARAQALSEGIRAGLSFASGAAEALPYPDGCFDGAIAARLLLHVDDPGAVIREMNRVVRPGGRVIVMDWDFETVTVDHPDRELTRRLLHWRCDRRGGNNWSGRQLWRHMHTAGFERLSVTPWVSTAHHPADGLTQSLWRAAQAACEGGAISPAEQEAWVAELESRLREGTFFASIVYFIVQGVVVSKSRR